MRKLSTILAMLLFSAVAAAQTPALGVNNQIVKRHAITIDSVTLAQPGFVVIHSVNRDGNVVLTPALGWKYLPAGRHEDVNVELDPKLLKRDGYVEGVEMKAFVMAHVDANDNHKYEFPKGPDHPVKVDGDVLVKPLQLRVPNPNNQM